MNVSKEIETILKGALPEALVFVLDPYQDNTHLEAIVVSQAFEGLSKIKQHQLVMLPLREAFSTTLHALSLKTFTPKKWEEVKPLYLTKIEQSGE